MFSAEAGRMIVFVGIELALFFAALIWAFVRIWD